MSVFQTIKIALGEQLHLSKDAMHIYVGLAVQLGAALLLRTSIRHWRPLLLVLAVAVAGEAWDIYDRLDRGTGLRWARHAHDIVNTAFWPTVLFLLARYTRLLKR